MSPDKALEAIGLEYDRAIQIHKAFNSAHEGKAVIEEELDELWLAIKENPKNEMERIARLRNMKEEAIQVAAMALRFLVDVCM
jgi:hypothetical protein